MKNEKYARPNPVVSGQTKPENREALERIRKVHPKTISELLDEALDIAIPKLLKRYPVNERTA